MKKKMQMNRVNIDLLKNFIGTTANMKKINSKANKEIEDKIYIEGLRKELGLSIKNKKANKWNR
jgi:hypothetical protein